MKQASVASLVALGFLVTPALAEAQPKPAAAAPEAAPPAAAEPAPAKAPAAAATSDSAPAVDDASAAPLAPAPGTPSGSFAPLPSWPEPGNDAAELRRQNAERPSEAVKTGEREVFAEDWWTHARPVLEMHGNFRVRAEMFYQFALGRKDQPATNKLWQQPAGNFFNANYTNQPYGPSLCTPDENGSG